MGLPIHLPKEVSEALHAVPDAMERVDNMTADIAVIKALLGSILDELRKANG